MGDPQQGRAGFAAELLHFKEYLPLDSHVQRRGGFIADDEIGLVQERNCNGDALTHAAGKLVRIREQAFVGRRNANFRERYAAAFACGIARNFFVCGDSLDHLRVDAQHRVQRHHRVLKNHRDAIAAQGPPLLVTVSRHVLAIQHDAAFDDATRWINQTHDRVTSHGFSGAGFTDKAEDLSLVDRERNVINGFHDTSFGEKMRTQVFDLQDGAHGFRP